MFLQGDPSTFVALVAALGLGGALGLIIGLLVGAGIVLALVPQELHHARIAVVPGDLEGRVQHEGMSVPVLTQRAVNAQVLGAALLALEVAVPQAGDGGQRGQRLRGLQAAFEIHRVAVMPPQQQRLLVHALLVGVQRVHGAAVEARLECGAVGQLHQPVGPVHDRPRHLVVGDHGEVRVVLVHVRVVAHAPAELAGGHHAVFDPPLRHLARGQPRLVRQHRPLRGAGDVVYGRLELRDTRAPPEPFVVLAHDVVIRPQLFREAGLMQQLDDLLAGVGLFRPLVQVLVTPAQRPPGARLTERGEHRLYDPLAVLEGLGQGAFACAQIQIYPGARDLRVRPGAQRHPHAPALRHHLVEVVEDDMHLAGALCDQVHAHHPLRRVEGIHDRNRQRYARRRRRHVQPQPHRQQAGLAHGLGDQVQPPALGGIERDRPSAEAEEFTLFPLEAVGEGLQVIGGGRAGDRPLSDTLLFSLTFILCFFTLVAVRTTVTLPIAHEANWVWRLTEQEKKHHYFSGLRKGLFFFPLLPLFVLLLLFYGYFWDWSKAGLHCLFGLATAWLLAEGLFLRFQKIPFTCSFMPGKARIQYFWLVYLAAFLVFVNSFSWLEGILFRYPEGFYIYFGVAAGLIAGVRLYQHLLFYRRTPLIYEEKLEMVMITLEAE